MAAGRSCQVHCHAGKKQAMCVGQQGILCMMKEAAEQTQSLVYLTHAKENDI